MSNENDILEALKKRVNSLENSLASLPVLAYWHGISVSISLEELLNAVDEIEQLRKNRDEELHPEITRLQIALEKISEGQIWHSREFARRVLEGVTVEYAIEKDEL